MTQASVGNASAATHLVPPGKPEEFDDPLKIINAISDGLSPSWWLNEILAATIGVNPLQELTNQLTGDWESYARCAAAWESLGKCMSAVSESLQRGLGPLDSGWQGNAADSAQVYFRDLSKAISEKQQILHQLHEEYLTAARGAWEFAKAAGDVIKDLLDAAIIAAIEVAAGAALGWTGVGIAIAWALAALECAKIVKLWADFVKLLNTAQKVMYGVHGAVTTATGLLGNVKSIPFPETTYNHPAVN
ncbi:MULTISPECIES: WXG100 family type VII secretion target [unclassified Crossiella]|uniref:WXG100 family type VII secretion target n=1 Tax=unclassified Crossiella TaxID=2620835 RepID=UPI001FFE4B5B|nr:MULTISPECIES: hypothetical protein [unclassified Crossiella]MCK2236589.1 hypothetical protein [Crossiella sp. S99.2]MCK2250256.1 hypothetical protein [Crossiella sp. S99.1]